MRFQMTPNKFKIGDRIVPDEKWKNYHYVLDCWKKFETRPYAIVKDVTCEGWVELDNHKFWEEGGRWNNMCFKLYKPEPKNVELPKELFEL